MTRRHADLSDRVRKDKRKEETLSETRVECRRQTEWPLLFDPLRREAITLEAAILRAHIHKHRASTTRSHTDVILILDGPCSETKRSSLKWQTLGHQCWLCAFVILSCHNPQYTQSSRGLFEMLPAQSVTDYVFRKIWNNKCDFSPFAYKMHLFHFQILFKRIIWKFFILSTQIFELYHISPTLGKLPTEHLREIMDTSMKRKGGQMK